MSKLLAGEKLLNQRIDSLLVDIKESSVRLTRRMSKLATEVEWLYLYLAQITLFTQQSNVIFT